MAQLFEAFGIDLHLLIAQALNFAVLFGALSYFLYKPVMKTLDERRALIAQGVADAHDAALKLETAETTAGTVLQSAEREAEGIVADARNTAGTERERIVREAEARSAAIAKDVDLRAAEAKAKALRESEEEIARLAILAAEKAMRNT